MVDCTHQVEAVDNHDDDHPYVLGKGEQELVEVVVFNCCLLLVEPRHVDQPVHELTYVVAEDFPYLVLAHKAQPREVVDHGGNGHVAVGSNELIEHDSRAQAAHHRVDAMLVALVVVGLDAVLHNIVDRVDVVRRHLAAQHGNEL